MIEITEVLDKIAEFMGWTKRRVGRGYPEWWMANDVEAVMMCSDFRPLEDWNDTMLVEARVREKNMEYEYIGELTRIYKEDNGIDRLLSNLELVVMGLFATQAQRMDALCALLKEKQDE